MSLMSGLFLSRKISPRQLKHAAQGCLKQKMEKRYADTQKRFGVLTVTMRRHCSISRRPLKPLQMTGINMILSPTISFVFGL